MMRLACTALLGVLCTACAAPDPLPDARSDDGTADTAVSPGTALPAAPADSPPAEPPGVDSTDAAWSPGPLEGGNPDAVATMRAVRVARQDGYDRVVFDFGNDPVPGYQVTRIEGRGARCGSGEPAQISGDHVVEVGFIPARAHTEEGAATIARRSLAPGLDVIRGLELVCDFEAHVTWLIGVNGGPRMRAGVLTDPNRLVLDFAATESSK